MNTIELPKLKERVYTEKISLAVSETTKKDLEDLKYKKRINTSEWLRQVIERELAALKKAG